MKKPTQPTEASFDAAINKVSKAHLKQQKKIFIDGYDLRHQTVILASKITRRFGRPIYLIKDLDRDAISHLDGHNMIYFLETRYSRSKIHVIIYAEKVGLDIQEMFCRCVRGCGGKVTLLGYSSRKAVKKSH